MPQASTAGQVDPVQVASAPRPDSSRQPPAAGEYASPTSHRIRWLVSGSVAGHPDRHCPPAAPFAAHAGAARQTPLPSQQPFGQLCALHAHWPPLHACPAGQAVPQPPQLPISVLVSTHAPEQRPSPGAHAIAHASPSQAAAPLPRVGPGQFVPHCLPQLLGSLSRTQEPPQAWAPGLHVDPQVAPPVQVAVAFAPAGHFPQAAPTPQLAASLFMAHVAEAPVPQRWSFALQVKPQAPPVEHVGVPPVTAGHCVPQPPQWLGSLFSSTHDVPQRLRPGSHPEVHANVEDPGALGEQTGVPPLHAVVHPPQWAFSVMGVSQPSSGFVLQIP